MKWINFLHLYQPANALNYTINEATDKSYYRLVRALENHPEIKFTFNISGCLILRWQEMGYSDIIRRISKLVSKGQLELTGTAAYHPLMPLVPLEESEAQIREHEQIIRDFIGKDIKLRGFFLPEMAYSAEVAKLVKSLGYEWLILDEYALGFNLSNGDFNQVFLDDNSGLKVVLRSRFYSNNFAPIAIANRIAQTDNKEELPKVIISATDGELYGLRHIDHKAEFEKFLKSKMVETETISEFVDSRKDYKHIRIAPHNWSSTEKDLKADEPYILWNEKNNTIQKKQWLLAQLAQKTIAANKNDKNYKWARWHLTRGLASCAFWWSSARDFCRQFGPVSWSPDEVERGTNDLVRSIRSLDNEETKEAKLEAELLYLAILKLLWRRHWTHCWKKIKS